MNLIAADYPFLEIAGTIIVFFAWMCWFWVLISVLGDLIRRHDISGWGKAAWTLFVIVVPFLGVLAYLGVHGKGMAERNADQSRAAQSQFDDYVKSVAAEDSASAEIERAKALLDSGTISQEEFETMKAKVLAS